MVKKKRKKKKKGKKGTSPTVPRSSPKKVSDRVQRWLDPTRHVYADAWQADHWLVPYDDDDSAHFHHRHEESNDHYSCGPQIFCCVKAMLLLIDLSPSWDNPQVHWEMTEGSHLVTWISERGPHTFYFFFCAPDDRNVLLFVGIRSSEARDVLLKRVPLDHYLDQAVRVASTELDD